MRGRREKEVEEVRNEREKIRYRLRLENWGQWVNRCKRIHGRRDGVL